MSARVRYAGGRPAARRMGEVEEETWTTIACDVEDVPQPDEIGKQKTTRRVYFAFRAEAEAWIAAQAGDGFTPTGIGRAATFYHGPTDAPGNCWVASSEREL